MRIVRTSFVILSGLLVWAASVLVPLVASASISGSWQFPLEQDWIIDPEFQFGSPYGGELHLGEDVEAVPGTSVQASANGRVTFTGNFPGYLDWGGLILVEHHNASGERIVSLYGHLDARSFTVRPGQIVNRGDRLGRVADKAHNGGWKPHLHLGLRSGAYTSSWVYWGFGSRATLNQWRAAHTYIPPRENLTDVARIPLAGTNRYFTAAAVSRWQFGGAGSVAELVIASGEKFQDALSATVLARNLDTPLLLGTASGLPTETLDELGRVLAPGGTVHLIGGEQALGPQVVAQLQSRGFAVERHYGAITPETSVAVADQLPDSDTVFVVSARSFADGLSSGVPASKLGAPILLTETDHLSPAVTQFISWSSSLTKIIVVGGESVVSPAVVAELQASSPSATIERIAGRDRWETNRLVAERFTSTPEVVTVATGEKFSDALVGAALAAKENGVLILSGYSSLRAGVGDYIGAVEPGVRLGVVLGGTAAVSEAVDIAVGQRLNPGVTAGSASEVLPIEAQPMDWASVPVQEVSGIQLPVPDGYELHELTLGGRQSVQVRKGHHDDAQVLLAATRLSADEEPVAAVTDWLNLNASDVRVRSDGSGVDLQRGLLKRSIEFISVENGQVAVLVAQEDREAVYSRLIKL